MRVYVLASLLVGAIAALVLTQLGACAPALYPKILTAQQVRDVAAYVESL